MRQLDLDKVYGKKGCINRVVEVAECACARTGRDVGAFVARLHRELIDIRYKAPEKKRL